MTTQLLEPFISNAAFADILNSDILSTAIQSDGKLLVGGSFTDYKSVGRNRLVRFNTDGTLDTAFATAAVDGAKFNGSILSIAIQSDDKILVGGNFTNYNGTTGRNRLVRLNTDGTLDTAFATAAVDGAKFNGDVQSIKIQSDGKILVSGIFSSYAGTLGRDRLVRLNPDGTLDDTFTETVTTRLTIASDFSSDVRSIAIQSDGKMLIGGGFLDYAGTLGRDHLVRLNPDGTLDTAFMTAAVDGTKFSGDVRSIAIQSDGKILVGGLFTNYAGTTNRNRLVRLNPDGTLDTAFATAAVDGNKFNGIIFSIAIQSDGKILVSGIFSSYAGTLGRNRLVRLNPDGTLDTAFAIAAADGNKFSGDVQSIAIQSDGKILAGGFFSNYAGITGRDRLVRLNPDGTLDTVFMTAAVNGAKFSSSVQSIAIQSDDKILVGGAFTNYALTNNRNRLVRLNPDGTLDTAFMTTAVDNNKLTNSVLSIAIQANGQILLGGNFTNYASTANRNRLVRLDTGGAVDTAFATAAVDSNKFGSSVNSIAIQANGQILVGGAFSNYAGGVEEDRLVRLNTNGTLDTAFTAEAVVDPARRTPNFTSNVESIAIQANGQILVGGLFTSYAGTPGRNYLVRFDTDGTVDTAFMTAAVDSFKFSSNVRSIAIQANGQILVGGDFLNYNGTSNRNRLVRLNPDGTLDTAFAIAAVDGNKFSGSILSIAIQSDDKILVGGAFFNYAGTSNRNRLVRLNTDGTLDTAFATAAVDGTKFSSSVNSIAIQANGQILVGGSFTNYPEIPGRDRLVRLNTDGTLDTVFVENVSDIAKFNGNILSAAIQSDGKILVGGLFINYAGTLGRNRLVRLNTDGTVDTAFAAAAVDNNKFGSSVKSIAIQANGQILVGGDFLNYGGAPGRNHLVRLDTDGTLDTDFTAVAVDGTNFTSSVESIAIQSDGRMLIGGGFFDYAGTPDRNHLVRLNTNGTLDTAFAIAAVDGTKFGGSVFSIAIQSDDKILVGGAFFNYAGTSNRNRLVRLNTGGTLDTAFAIAAVDDSKFNSNIFSIAIQANGQILVGGAFASYAGTAGRSRLVRLNTDGTVDTAFAIAAVDGFKFSGDVQSIAIQANDKILVGGSFQNYAGTTGRDRLIGFNTNGTLDTTFMTAVVDGNKFSNSVFSIAINSRNVFIGGTFFYGPIAGRSNLVAFALPAIIVDSGNNIFTVALTIGDGTNITFLVDAVVEPGAILTLDIETLAGLLSDDSSDRAILVKAGGGIRVRNNPIYTVPEGKIYILRILGS